MGSLHRCNELLYDENPGAITTAEECTAWAGVSAPTRAGGLSFGFKWNMGWMRDRLDYMAFDPVYRRWHYHRVTFGMPLSYDEVGHGKGSILARMPGDDWHRFANFRVYYGFMCGPARQEAAVHGPGVCALARARCCRQPQLMASGPRAASRHTDLDPQPQPPLSRGSALHTRDCEPPDTRRISADDRENSLFAWIRAAPGPDPVVVVSNFAPVPRLSYRIARPPAGRRREVLNADAAVYGGSGPGNQGEIRAVRGKLHGLPVSAVILASPLTSVYFPRQPG